jgi:hypothetical protein
MHRIVDVPRNRYGLAVLEDLVFSDSGAIANNGIDSLRLSPD